MKIEVLFSEMCNLFGDLKGIDYLSMCVPEAEVVYTSYTEEPLFVTEQPSLIYMGPMSEKTQEKVIEKLLPYRERLFSLIQNNTLFFFTGNAMEVLGKYIENEDGSKIRGLDLLPIWVKRNMMRRHNSTLMGTYQDISLVGFKSQFTMAYTDTDAYPFIQVEKGIGLNKKLKFEGIQINHFFGTYVLGPIFVLNPPFTKKILKLMGVENPQLAFEEDVEAAYEALLKDFKAKT